MISAPKADYGFGSKLFPKPSHNAVNLFELHTSAYCSCSKKTPIFPYQGFSTKFARVLGPPSISQLMTSLESNTLVRHFLLGNNLIGPAGARLISEFVLAHPDRMGT